MYLNALTFDSLLLCTQTVSRTSVPYWNWVLQTCFHQTPAVCQKSLELAPACLHSIQKAGSLHGDRLRCKYCTEWNCHYQQSGCTQQHTTINFHLADFWLTSFMHLNFAQNVRDLPQLNHAKVFPSDAFLVSKDFGTCSALSTNGRITAWRQIALQ